MKKTDKILIGIVAGIILLVVVAFGIALSQPKAAYQTEDTPQGVAFNYLFALQQDDYERAYGYLFPSLRGYPRDVEAFAEDIRDRSYTFNGLYNSSTSLEVESVNTIGKRANVKILETRFYEGDLFSSSQYTDVFYLTLQQDENGVWKIVDGDDYWLHCWEEYGSCK